MNKLIRNNLIIELHVPDFKKVKDFYGKLGFTVSHSNDINEKEQGYLTMTRTDKIGNTLLNFYGGDKRIYTQSFFKQFPQDTPRGFEVEITIPTSDIEAFYAEISKSLKSYIVRELAGLKDHNHSWQDFRMIDPFGFYLRFTELLDWGQK